MDKTPAAHGAIHRNLGGRTLIAACALLMTAAVAVQPVDAAGADSPACADYKGDNGGTGGDKYTECNAHPDNGTLVNFVCTHPSANALLVIANDANAEAKGKLECKGVLVARCNGNIQCEGAATWRDQNDVGSTHDGNCLSGTDEAFDSGMAWSCASVGGAFCDGAECDPQDLLDDAIERVKRAIGSRDLEWNIGSRDLTSMADFFHAESGLTSLAVGVVADDGESLGLACQEHACALHSVSCIAEATTRWCSLTGLRIDDDAGIF